jgi:hypothetical protein
LNALPGTNEGALLAIEHDIGMTLQSNATRSHDWLSINGNCIDNIKPEPSTIDGAGHGVFAKRNF